MHADGINLLLLGVPLLLVLVAGVLRVDEHVFTSDERKKAARRRFGVAEQAGEPVYTDPDGRPYRPNRKQPK